MVETFYFLCGVGWEDCTVEELRNFRTSGDLKGGGFFWELLVEWQYLAFSHAMTAPSVGHLTS